MAIDDAVVFEEEKANVAMPSVTSNTNLIFECLARRGKVAVVGQCATKQSIDPFALVEEIDAHVADEHQVGLTRLDHEAGGHMTIVQVPSALLDVSLSPNRTSA